jgi:hypothetical protein
MMKMNSFALREAKQHRANHRLRFVFVMSGNVTKIRAEKSRYFAALIIHAAPFSVYSQPSK